MKRYLICIILIVLLSVSVYPQKKAMTFSEFAHLKMISGPQISPDGKWVVFSASSKCYHNNITKSALYLVSTDGGEVKQLTSTDYYNGQPTWSPDGKNIVFVSSRSGSSQIWMLPSGPGEARQITNIETGASGPIFSPDGKNILFVSDVSAPITSEEEKADEDLFKEYDKIQAKIIDGLLYRHWNEWRHNVRSHLHIVPAGGGQAKDLTVEMDHDTPPISLGGNQDYSFSPDGKEITFTMNTEKVVTLGTNNDIFTMPTEGGKEFKKLTLSKANDIYPLYSPDGKYISYLAMKRPGFEADQLNLILYNRQTGEEKNLTENFDRSIGEYLWTPDSRGFIAACQDMGNSSIYKIDLNGKIDQITEKTYNNNLTISADGKFIVFGRQAINAPPDLYKMDMGSGREIRLTEINKRWLEKLDLNPMEYFSYKGGKTTVYGHIIKPPLFDSSRKYPVVFLIHGGPQGMWGNSWHPRWNAQMFAAPGYVVVMFNPTGSTGYGQKLTDDITKDWGGTCYEDIMKGVDYVLENYDYVDKDKIGAAGGSFGGYMVNWIAGHNDRFNCLISHAGLFDLRSMFYVTEELWFPLWELGGNPAESKLHEKYSPSNFVKNFKTPTLVIHGERDYRVPVGQGFGMFTALQIMNVPSKLLYFPDEYHFVTKPQNMLLWWDQVHKWFAKYLK